MPSLACILTSGLAGRVIADGEDGRPLVTVQPFSQALQSVSGWRGYVAARLMRLRLSTTYHHLTNSTQALP